MSATTRWRDAQSNNFDEIIDKMTAPIPDDARTNSVYRINFTSRKLLEQNESTQLNGTNITYNIIKYGYDQITAQTNPDEDRVIRKNGTIVVILCNSVIYYIVDQNSAAKRLLRKMLDYTGKNEIESCNFDFSEDFFVWVVSKVYNSEVAIENSSTEELKILQLEEIKGIRGNTEDLQTKVATSGESVMNVLSTLAFILESRKLNQVKLNLRYTNHDNIIVKLQSATIEFETPYIGIYNGEDMIEVLYAKVYLLLYFEILPLLEQEYKMAKDGMEWNQDAYVDFLSVVKDTIIDKIEDKINSLR